jgi:predicted enzyme related to lactoylglutathione lyase
LTNVESKAGRELRLIGYFLPKITEHGGKVFVPKTAVPGIDYLIYRQDTESNIFGILQEDRSAQ